MKFPICVTNRKQTASFRIASLMLAIAPLWLMLALANRSAQAQTSSDVSSATTSPAPSPGDWTQFHRDNMQRWNPNETVLGVNNVGSLKLKWTTEVVPTGNGDGPVFSPVVANGVVYVGSTGFAALNASTGAQLWGSFFEPDFSSSPAVANGVVYAGSIDHNVYAFNASTGARLWNYSTGGGVGSSPTVVNGVVYVGSSDKNVYALNASTGAKLWSFTTGGTVDSSPAVANGVVYVGSDDNNVYALNASTGAKLWSFATGGEVESSPAVANGVVYVGSDDNNLYALNASTGAKLWSNIGAGQQSSPAVANGVVYIIAGTSIVEALNASTGAKLWRYDTDPGTNFQDQIAPPIVVNGVVYISVFFESFLDGIPGIGANVYAFSVGADLFLRVQPSSTTVHQGDLLTYTFPVWNLGPTNAVHEVLNTQIPAGTTFDYIRISGTPGLGTCTTPRYQGTGQIVCHENGVMAPNTTWTVRLTVKVTAPSGTVITENAATMADTSDPNTVNDMATVNTTVQ